MALVEATTVARVKALLDIGSSVHDTVIAALIASVSQRFEGFMGRLISAEARTEEHDWPDNRRETLFLRAYPVTAIASIKNDPAWDFAAADALDATSYHLVADTGEVHMRYPLLPGPKAVQVVYTGGLAANTAALIAAYPAIAFAADLQCAAVWRRRSSPQGSTAVVPLQGSLSQEAPLELIPEVVEALSPFRRLRFGV